MQSKVVIGLLVMSFIYLVGADFEIDEEVLNEFVKAAIIDDYYRSTVQCVPYSEACNAQSSCCQYWGHAQMQCIAGQCLQSQCGYEGQHCGPFIGECCFHRGLSCTWMGPLSICSRPSPVA